MPARLLPKQAFSLVAAASFTSGALTMALEMILMRLATRYTGSAATGTTMALTVYLLGLLAGSALVLRLNNKNRGIIKDYPFWILGALVSVSGALWAAYASAALSLPLLSLYGGVPISCLLIFAPACLAGTIFPMLLLLGTRFYFGSRESFQAGGAEVTNFGKKGMLLYLVSNLGSALGAMGSAIWLLPRLGIGGSLALIVLGWVALSLAMIPLLVAARKAEKTAAKAIERADQALEKYESDQVEEEIVDIADAVVGTSQPFTFVCVFAASLFGLLFECLAIRMLALLCGASFVTTTCAVAATLLAIALGARIALFLPVHKNTRLPLALALGFAAIGLALVLILLPHLNNVFQALRQLTLSDFSGSQRQIRWLGYLYPRLILSLIFCLTGGTGLSILFPVAAKTASRPQDMLSLYIAAGLGTMIAPLVFMACMGLSLPNMPSSMELMLRLMIVVLVALAVAAAADQATARQKTMEAIFSKSICLTTTLAAVAVLLLIKPLAVSKIDMGLTFVAPDVAVKEVEADEKSSRRIFYREGRTATISVLAKDQDNTISLRSDGKIEGTVPIELQAPSFGSDLPTQSLLALLPLIWRHGTGGLKSCLLIGYGTGTTAATIANAAPAASLTVAEIEPAVIEAGKCFKQNAALVPPGSLTTCDARHFLQDSQAAYDAIVSQPAEPWVQGSSNLYSLEFYRLVRSHLSKNGTFCQWLQLYGMDEHGLASALSTFDSVFPTCLVYHPHGAGELIVLGFNSDHEPNIESVQKNFLAEGNRKLLALAGINDFQALQAGLWLNSEKIGQAIEEWQSSQGAVLVTDDNLALELDTVPEIENASRCIQLNMALLDKWINKRSAKGTTNPRALSCEQATALLTAGDEEGAAILARRIGDSDPGCVSAINLQALVALRQGKMLEAQVLLSRSLDLNPSDASTHVLKCLSCLFASKAASAIDEADIAHRLNKLDYQPYLLSAAAYHLAGDNSQALTMLRRARQICTEGVILKQVDDLAGEFSRPILPTETSLYSGTLASRLSRLLRVSMSSSSKRCSNVL